MSWRAPTADDLAVRISDDEIVAYSGTSALDDPVGGLIALTADEVRGYVAANRAAVLCDDAHSLPTMLIGPCMDLAAYNLLKRLDVVPNEARTAAKNAAVALFEKVAAGKITPEPGKDAASDEASVSAPSITVKPAIL